MNKKKFLYKGAEAEIILDKFMGQEVVRKQRISKSYRIKQIDNRLISSRTKEEAKLISETRRCGVCVPIIYDIDIENGSIIMEYIKGKKIKDILNTLDKKTRDNLCFDIGRNIALFHNNDIIHGDITTSNMMLSNDRIYFIDFGLGCKTPEIEAKGVDLHVLMEAIESTHSKYSKCFDKVLEGYKKEYKKDSKTVIKKIEEIVRRGRYR